MGEAISVYLPGYYDINPGDTHIVSLLNELDFAEYSEDCFCVLFYPFMKEQAGLHEIKV